MKKICLDADGVLLNYNIAWGNLYSKLFNQKLNIVNPHAYHAYEMFGVEKPSKEQNEIFYAEFNKNGWKSLPAIDGAVEAVNKLKDSNYLIYVVTSMPKNALEDRIENLLNVGFPIFNKVIATGRTNSSNPKESVIKEIQPDFFVDDMKKNFIGLEKTTQCVYINPKISNYDYQPASSILKYKDLKAFVENKIEIKNLNKNKF